MKFYLLFIAFLFSISIAYAEICYQENTNDYFHGDNFCSQSFNGNYSYDNTSNCNLINIPYSHDGNWDSYGSFDIKDINLADCNGNYYINYKKPTIYLFNATSRIKGNFGTQDIDLPLDCFNSSDYIRLKVNTTHTQFTGRQDLYFSCYNGSQYLTLYGGSNVGISLYEESIIWNISSLTTWIERNQTYNNLTFSKSTETFNIIINYDSSYYSNVIGYLVYNNTFYTPEISYSTDTATLKSTINIPQVVSNTNISFYWELGLINTTGTNYFNSTYHNQTVNPLLIDNCSSYSIEILNYSLKDEVTQSDLNGAIELNTLVYSSDISELIMNYSHLYNNTNNAKVCISSYLLNNSKYSLFSQAKYYSSGFSTEYYYIQNYSLTNSTLLQNIKLFDLLTTTATPFLMTYTGSTFLAVSGAIININREYPSEGVYKTVEAELTDNSGNAIGYFDTTAKYQIIVTKNGQVLTTFSSITPYCASTSLGCTLNLNAASPYASSIDYSTYLGLDFSQSFNDTTNIYSLTFATVDNSIANMNVTIYRDDNLQNTILCSNSVSTSSGTLTCSITATQNESLLIKVFRNNQEIFNSHYEINTSNQIFSNNLAFFVFGTILCLGIMFVPSPIGVVIGTILGLVIASLLFFISGAYITGGFMIVIIIAGGLIIWRLRQGGSD